MKRRTDREVMALSRTVWGIDNDARFWDGLRTYGPNWGWRYLLAAIRRGAARKGTDRPENRR